MAYSEQVLHRAKLRLAQEKINFESESAAQIEQIYRQFPRLREIDTAMRQSVIKAVTAAFKKGEDTTAAIEKIKEENLALQQERAWILEANELDEASLEPGVLCPHCGGTGYMGAVMCECLQELCRQEQKKELSSLLAGKETFENFRLDYYSATEHDPKTGETPRALMQKTFLNCKNYAAGFSLRSPSLLFTGGPGLGKTYLSACIARTVADNGFSVVYDTAGQLVADFEAEKFGGDHDADLTEKYLQCDLLIIDDLGTEMTTQFSLSVLYRVINSRMMAELPVIISTNLSTAAISQRYPGPIASRLLGTYHLCPFIGTDIRSLRR